MMEALQAISWRKYLIAFIISAFLFSPIMACGADGENAPGPGNVYRGDSFTGTATYAQIESTSSTFAIDSGSLTLTGNLNGVLLTGATPTITLANSGDANLYLQKGTLTVNELKVLSRKGTAFLHIGSGAAGNLETVTINGNISGIPQGAAPNLANVSNIIVNGANLVVNGRFGGGGGYVGHVSVLNGNVTLLKTTSASNEIGILTVNPNFTVTSEGRLNIVQNLNLAPGSKLIVTELAEHFHIMSQLNRNTGKGLQPGSNIISARTIKFSDFFGTGGGIKGASGKIQSSENIEAFSNEKYYDLLQGDGSLTLEADGSITARDINADTIKAGAAITTTGSLTGQDIEAGTDILSAGAITGGAVSAKRDINAASIAADSATAKRNLITGSPPQGGQIVLASAGKQITPTGTLTASTISGQLVAAGEISDQPGLEGHVGAAKLMVVKNTGATPTSGNFTLHNGSFAFVGTEPAGASGYNEDGSIASHSESAWIGGDMSVNNTGASSFTTLGVGGSTRISGGSLSGDVLNTASAQLGGGITANINRLNITAPAGFVAIGAPSDSGVSQVSITNLALNGAELWVGAGGGSARAVIPNFIANGAAGNFTDSDIHVGHNGMLSLGAADAAWLPELAATAAMPQSAAVLGVASPFTLGGGLYVDSAWEQPAGQSRMRPGWSAGEISFSGNSLFVMDGSKAETNYAGAPVATAALPAGISGALSSTASATANVGAGAKIYIDGVTPGRTYVALGKNISTVYEDDTAWNGANLLTSNPLLALTRLGDGKEGQFAVIEEAPHAKQIAAASAVPRLSRSASEIMESAIYYRIRLGHEDLNRRDWALWALPVYERINEFGLDGGSGSYGYTGGIGGLAIGCDYTWEDTLRAGIALNIGTGYARSTGEVASTKNHLDFWGVGLYGVWKPGAISLDGEVDFTSTYNKLKQDLPAGLPASEVKADAPAWTLGASLRLQYEFDTDWLIIRPHAGVRYFHLNTQPYDVKMNGADVLRSHRYYQNVWTFPVGIVFTKEIKLENGLEITPLINLKAIPASGDTYVKNSIRYTGSAHDLDLETQVMDDVTWGGRAGLEFRMGDFSAGINYTAQFGSHTSNQGVFGVLRYEF